MTFTKVDLVQVITSISILIGLMLVIYEIQQTRKLVYTQMVQATYSEVSQEQSVIYGENGAKALANACLKPANLTQEEAYVIDTMFNNKLLRIARIKRQETYGGYDSNWETAARNVTNTITGFPRGAAWLNSVDFTDLNLKAVIYERMATLSTRPCHKRVSTLFDESS